MKKSRPTAVVIIPTYNERQNIVVALRALSEVFSTISNWHMMVLVVDDTSPDKTYEVVEGLKKKYSFLHLYINQKKAGLGGAYLKGMSEAFGHMKADVVFEFDADLSHDPTKIPLMLTQIEQGSDLVLGSRYVKGGGIPDDWGWHRKFLSVVGNWIIMVVLTDFRIRDWTSGYRAITRKVYEAVNQEMTSHRFTGYTFQIGFLHKAVRRGFKVSEVPFKFVDRTEGESKLGPEYIKNTLIYILKVRLQEILQHRIFKFVMVGGLGALVQFVSLAAWRLVLPNLYQVAFFLSIETAVVSNFIWSNLWTFADRKLSAAQIPSKFLQFNLASAGSIVIQQIVALVGEFTLGLIPLFVLPVVGVLDTGYLYAVLGIFLGMFWNFFAYSNLIWKSKAK